MCFATCLDANWSSCVDVREVMMMLMRMMMMMSMYSDAVVGIHAAAAANR